MHILNMMLLRKLPVELLENKDLLVGCVAGAILKEDYLKLMEKVGFKVRIIGEDTKISSR
jgi:arsenite methyltransferase